MRTLFSICSTLTLALLIAVAVKNTNPEWKSYQKEFAGIAAERLDDAMYKSAMGDGVVLRQVYLKDLDKIDRCVTCHLGIELKGMEGAEQPYAPHPGDILSKHPVEKFGCTVCHEGQGLATNKADAHANDIKFWETPMLMGNMLYASCVKCHKDDSAVNTVMYIKGKTLFSESGCQGCHKVNGKGGHLGPDLSDISRASIYIKHPVGAAHGHEPVAEGEDEEQHEATPEFYGNTNVEYIYESVKYPKLQPQNSAMVDYGFSNEEAMALTVYLKSFNREEMPSEYVVAQEDDDSATAERGHKIYRQYCTACHGRSGEGTRLPELGGTIGPAVGNQQFLSIVDMPMLERVISDSRGGVMPAWGKSGGLTKNEIASVAIYLKTIKTEGPTFEEVASYRGRADYGATLFKGNCSACHGVNGEYEQGLIGPSLRSPELLSLADDRFWYETLMKGREGTAMPSWSYLTREKLSDLVAYLRTFRNDNATYAAVKSRIASGANADNGRKTYRGKCSGCHGLNGEGGIGPSLNNPELQSVADADFIARTVLRGRAGTAMPAFTYVDSDTIGDIVKYVKTWQKGPSKTLSGEIINGSEYRGEKLFSRICSQCHGSTGQGGIGPAILNIAFLATVSDNFIKEMISYGRSGSAMKPNLITKQGTTNLSSSQIDDIVSYMRSFEDRPIRMAGSAAVDGTYDLGKSKYDGFCSQCHGPSGIGGTGPAIGKKGFLETVSDGFIQAIVTNGRTGTEMKPFSGDEAGGGITALTENDISDIIHFLRTESATNTGGSKHVVGNPGAGELLFVRNCGQCHGGVGKKGFAPALNNKSFLSAASDSYLQATMVLGRHDTQMKSMVRGGGGVVEMDSSEVNSIIVYLKSLKEKYQ